MKDSEREIDLKAVLFDCLLHWRGAILFLVIGLILGGAFGFYKSYSGSKSVEEAQQMTSEDYLNGIIAEEEAGNKVIIKKAELATIEQTVALNNYLNNTQAYRDFFNYDKFDCNNVPTFEYIFAVKADDMKSSSDLVNKYVFYLKSNDFKDYVANNTDLNTDYIFDLVKYTVSDTSSIDALQFDIKSTDPVCIFRVQAVYYDENSCKILADAVSNYLLEVSKSLKKESVKHEFLCLSENFSFTYSAELVNLIKGANDAASNANITIGKNIDSLSEEGKIYYNMRLDELNDPKESDAEAEEDSSSGIKSIIKSCIKFGAVGAVGLVVVFFGCIVLFKYVLGGKIYNGDELTSLYEVNILANVFAAENKKKAFGFIDNLIIKLRDSGKRKFDLEKSLEIATSAIRIAAKKNELSEVTVIGCNLSEIKDVSGKLYEKLAKDNIKAVELDNILYDPESLGKVSGNQGAVLMVRLGNTLYDEFAKEIEILKSQEVKILGVVTVDI